MRAILRANQAPVLMVLLTVFVLISWWASGIPGGVMIEIAPRFGMDARNLHLYEVLGIFLALLIPLVQGRGTDYLETKVVGKRRIGMTAYRLLMSLLATGPFFAYYFRLITLIGEEIQHRVGVLVMLKGVVGFVVYASLAIIWLAVAGRVLGSFLYVLTVITIIVGQGYYGPGFTLGAISYNDHFSVNIWVTFLVILSAVLLLYRTNGVGPMWQVRRNS